MKVTPVRRLYHMQWIIAVVVVLLAGCDVLNPVTPTTVPTWEFTGPTLEPTRPPISARATEPISGALFEGQNNPTAAALPADSELPPVVLGQGEGSPEQDVQITLRDGFTVTGRLYSNPPVEIEGRVIAPRLPGLLLIGTPPVNWGDIPIRLRNNGYTVLAIDLGIRQTVQGFRDVLGAFSEVGSVAPGLISVVGVGQGADLALLGCAADQLCDALVLFGPLRGDMLADAMTDYNPRPLFVVASRDDTTSYQAAQRIAVVATGEIELELFEDAGRGIEILRNRPEIIDAMMNWLQLWLIE